jgi:Acetyltransferase (GNAT) domain
MSANETIQYLQRQQINEAAWNSCIAGASNGLIYAQYDYLSSICGDWDALVLGDYIAVMPLVWRRKWGIYYLYYPPFCAALGVFGNNLNEVLLNQFLTAIPVKFRYWDFPLNHENNFDLREFPFQQRNNFVLSLASSYTTINSAYRQNLQRNINKAAQFNFMTDKNFPVTEVIRLAKNYTPNNPVSTEMYKRFENMYALFSARQQAFTYGIRNLGGELMASCVFLKDAKRLYYVLVGNHPNGRTAGASHALIDACIKDYAGQRLLLDFEGSDISKLAFFYSGFGASSTPYSTIKLNRLPLAVKWMKMH